MLYLRQVSGAVYGFGEHPGSKYAYVLTGTISGDRITGKWWDVPKGSPRPTSRGTLQLRFTQGGARVVRSGGTDLGPDTFTSISASGIPWPNRQAAGFQATTRGDLDGVFAGDDSSRHYVREVGADTVWVAEKVSQPAERPGWVSVFIGTRGSSGTSFSGMSIDVPKGVELRSTNLVAVLVSGKRELVLAQPGLSRTKRLPRSTRSTGTDSRIGSSRP